MKHLASNKYQWDELTRERKTLPILEEIQDLKTTSQSIHPLLLHLLVPPKYKLVAQNNNKRRSRIQLKEHGENGSFSRAFGLIVDHSGAEEVNHRQRH